MKIRVLLAGVADIRFPLHEVALGAGGTIEEAPTARRLLSPFDEAALELALKLRDGKPGTRVEVWVLGGPNGDALLRAAAAFKPDALQRVDLQPARLWDAAFTARQLASLLARDKRPADLLLIGREFGDLDEGSVPVLLARRLGLACFSLAQHAEWQGDGVRLMREQGTCEQWLDVAAPLLASVTNDRRNKLRHPLMKNVMEAKRMTFEVLEAAGEPCGDTQLLELAPALAASRGGDCRMLGGRPAEQAEALLGWLREQGVKP
jgi:electron transfer flavoprotein beta subunit